MAARKISRPRQTIKPVPSARAASAPALADSVGYLIRQLQRAISREMEQRIAPYGISIGMWYFLRVLWETDGLSQAELSERIGIVGPTTVSAINRMERDGLVVRRGDPNDGRKVIVSLLPKAKQLKAKLLPLAAEVLADAQRGLDAREAAALRRALSVLALNLRRHLPAMLVDEIEGNLMRER